MAGWMHRVCVGACSFVSPQCGFFPPVFCNYVEGMDALAPNCLSYTVHDSVLMYLGPSRDVAGMKETARTCLALVILCGLCPPRLPFITTLTFKKPNQQRGQPWRMNG